MDVETLIGGFGGQGILMMGRVLATAAMIEGYEVSWYPSYGPEMRGGTANCTVIVSTESIGATLSEHPDVFIAMNEPALSRYGSGVKPGGLLAVNSSLVHREVDCPGRKVLQVPANDLVERVSNPRALNMVMLGAVLTAQPFVRFASLQQAIGVVLDGKPEELIQMNQQAVEVGREFIIHHTDTARK